MNKISEKYADYFTVCSSSTPDSDLDCENIEDNGKRSSSKFRVKCNLNCPEKVKKLSPSEPTPTPNTSVTKNF
jgi:hypothetical protein